uniref:Uncharacterized protein n=1 Tax=Pithovirus LCPAC304 TaxID=2506594 RepID=A0A481Z835_9VIRU|nr:MAG: hypothetical protein LCPAC304_04100 [Pithovirus LCPAC304]
MSDILPGTQHEWKIVYTNHAHKVINLIFEVGSLREIMINMPSMQRMPGVLSFLRITEMSDPSRKVHAFFDYLGGTGKQEWFDFFNAISVPKYKAILDFWKNNGSSTLGTRSDRSTPTPIPRREPSRVELPRVELPFLEPDGNVSQWIATYYGNQSLIAAELCSSTRANQYVWEMPILNEGCRAKMIGEADPDKRAELIIGYMNEHGREGWIQFFKAMHKLRHCTLKRFWYPRRDTPTATKEKPCVASHVRKAPKTVTKVTKTDQSIYPPGDNEIWLQILTNGGGALQSLFTTGCINSLVREMVNLRHQPVAASILEGNNPYQRNLFMDTLRSGGYWKEFFDALRKQRKFAILTYWYGQGYEG